MGFFSKIIKSIKKVFKPELPEIPEPESGDLVNKDAADASLPIIYGERKAGGTRVFVSTGTNATEKNKYLYICLAICEGEIESITGLQLNDVAIATADDTATDVSGQTVAEIQASGNNNKTLFQTFTGTATQAASTLLTSAGTEWTTAHQLKAVAYIAIRLYWNSDKFSTVPTITAIIKGKKVSSPASPSTFVWSDNPALCLRNYLMDARFGKGLPISAIDEVSFASAETDCNQLVVSYTGAGNIKLLTCNVILKSSKTLFENVKTFLSGMRGLMPYTNGKYSLFIDRETPVGYTYFDLTPDNILSDLQVVSTSKKNQYNRVKIKFTNPDTNWQPDFAIWPPSGSSEETAFLSADDGEVMSAETEMLSVTNYYRARDLARVMCLTSRSAKFSLELTCLSECLEVAVGDVVRVEQPTMGWSNSGGTDSRQLFRVTAAQIINSGEVDLSLERYDRNNYIWAVSSGITTPPITTLPDPFAVNPPTNLQAAATGSILSDGSLVPTIDVTWDAPVDGFVEFYDVEWKKSGSTNFNSAVSYTTEYQITDIIKDVVYNIRVRSVNALGAKSTFATVNSTGVGDTTAPDIPTNITLNEGLKSLSLTWVAPPQNDYSHCNILRSTTGNANTFVKIGSAIAGFTDNGLGYNQTRYYKLKSVDYSENQSAPSAAVSGTTAMVGGDAFVDGVTGLFEGAGLKPIEFGNTLPTANANTLGDLFFLTTDNSLYRCVSVFGVFVFTKTVPATDITGKITETQITDDAISAPKIAANAVTAQAIQGGTITGNKIVANTITGGLLATAGIITQAAQINDLVVTNSKINFLAVDTLQINGGAVTIPRSGSSNPQTNLTVGVWTQAATTTGVTWTSIFDIPSSINVVATANLLGATGTSNNYHSFFLRVTAYWNNNNSSAVLEEVGASNLAPNSMTLTLNHSFTPAFNQSGINFRIEVKSNTQTKRLGANGLTVLSCMR